MRRARSAFTLVELLISMTIVAILAAIALPKFRDVKTRATATQIIGDFDVVRHAAMSFYVDSGYFPAEAGRATMPRNLAPYLPNGFKMARSQWTLDYQNWPVPATQYTKGGSTVGVTFSTPDHRLGMTAMRLAGSRTGFVFGSEYTILISF